MHSGGKNVLELECSRTVEENIHCGVQLGREKAIDLIVGTKKQVNIWENLKPHKSQFMRHTNKYFYRIDGAGPPSRSQFLR